MISAKGLEQFGRASTPEQQPEVEHGFGMDAYLAKNGFEVVQKKPWQSHPSGTIYELAECPFDPSHRSGSAALTLLDGSSGFRCQHNSCRERTIKDVFRLHPPERAQAAAFETSASIPTLVAQPTQSQQLVELAATSELFHTSDRESFASFPVGNHREIWPLKSTACRNWLIHRFYQKTGKPPGSQALQDAISLLDAKAQFDSPERKAFTRVAAGSDNRIFIDLCNREWEAIEISCTGWRVVRDPPVRFRRPRSAEPLPIPTRNGSVSGLRRLINIGDDSNWILLLSWIIAALRPVGPYPILIIQGEQGSAKSTAAKFVRRLIDPAKAPLRTPPRDERDLLIAANNSWVVAFDNLSGVPNWLSDALCRLATGGGFAARELYTNTEETILELTRPVILNGIDYVAARPDLADRAVILQLPRISDRARCDEADLASRYDNELPGLLGALCTSLSAALAELPRVKMSHKPRMADFAIWATAAEQSLGFPAGAFIDVYRDNRDDVIQDTLDSDPVSNALTHFLDSRGDHPISWTGTAGQLLEQLTPLVNLETRASSTWPSSPRALATQLRRLTTCLRHANIDVTFRSRRAAAGTRLLTVTRTSVDFNVPTATIATGQNLPLYPQSLKCDNNSDGQDIENARTSSLGDRQPFLPSRNSVVRPQGTVDFAENIAQSMSLVPEV